MGVEIERKFLLINEDWRKQVKKSCQYRQGYMGSSEKASIRVRTQAEQANINIKSATLGIQRMEYEYEIPLGDANEMLDQLCKKPIIEKTRHFVEFGQHLWEIDVFEGDNAGLVVAEIELQSEQEEFSEPSWLGEEVSGDQRYYNVCLVKHPYKDW